MPKPEWGSKRQCKSCGAKFYDLKKDPIHCPKCNAVFEIVEPKVTVSAVDKVKKPVPKAVAPIVEGDDLDIVIDDDADIVLDDDDADDALIDVQDDDGGDVTDVVGDVATNDEDSHG